ncbi:MAG: hypothetical protein LH649_16100 [Pseudanabaena sp. CAN_BIN31]|nr:hypothetical protein [Pseudanabaena sp. CAN_BIN31]
MDITSSLNLKVDQDLFKFVLEKDAIRIRRKNGQITTDDIKLIKRVSEIIKNYLVDIKKLLDQPNKEYSTQYIQLAKTAKLAENISKIFNVKINAYIAIFVARQEEISTNLYNHSGISPDTKKFLVMVQYKLEEYKRDIEFIVSKK